MSRIEKRSGRRRSERTAVPRAELRRAIDRTGLSKGAAAKCAGISRQHLYNLMGGRCAPGIQTARAVVRALAEHGVPSEIAVLFP